MNYLKKSRNQSNMFRLKKYYRAFNKPQIICKFKQSYLQNNKKHKSYGTKSNLLTN